MKGGICTSDYEPEPIDTDDGTDGDDSEAAGTGPEDQVKRGGSTHYSIGLRPSGMAGGNRTHNAPLVMEATRWGS